MTSGSPWPPLPASDAFFHLIYDHRYLAVAAHAWSRFGPDGVDTDQTKINEFVPGAGVLIQDSLLIRARVLIDFYTSASSDPTDIVLGTFGLPPISQARTTALERCKNPISVHLMHLTAWRDEDYRNTHQGTAKGSTRFRIDWNRENLVIVQAILDALTEVAGLATPWSKPFQRPWDAMVATIKDPSDPGWPPELGEKADVKTYLDSIGLVAP